MHLLSRVPPEADRRIAYGALPHQFGDLWLPRGQAEPCPVVVFFHGGWWKSAYDLEYASHLCAALRDEGIACWSVEYRRVGDTGGGWPFTSQDAATGFDFVATLAQEYPLDLSRMITMGHSAGGHLAFWIAGRPRIDPASELHLPGPHLSLIATVALAGAVDLRLTIKLAGQSTFAHDREEVHNLMGGSPLNFPTRYAAANPGDLLPFGVPQVLIQGAEDDQIPPELPLRWAERSQAKGDTVALHLIPSADHFDVVDPKSAVWPILRDCVRRLLFPPTLKE